MKINANTLFNAQVGAVVLVGRPRRADCSGCASYTDNKIDASLSDHYDKAMRIMQEFHQATAQMHRLPWLALDGVARSRFSFRERPRRPARLVERVWNPVEEFYCRDKGHGGPNGPTRRSRRLARNFDKEFMKGTSMNALDAMKQRVQQRNKKKDKRKGKKGRHQKRKGKRGKPKGGQ
jgi:hypothetical protein